ncbi:Acetoacetyl-CoA synthetase [Thelohanellus kitauei]|uniref:Acetoacetyl-CoA synthetase n=1 Tax=Thelohanellus kitauei TaxID=669202 RepID=A0A0C2N5V2_THEKT|nr:Acetoacetyl-CoA synthetase [Thelohanellus kitauei]
MNEYVKSGIPICSIAGATDIISCFAGHNLTLPVYPGEIQYCNLGMHVQCFNEIGKHIYDEFGEFVCIKPFPSMPVYFKNDPGNVRYKETYFSRYPGVWTHGDYCLINSKTGGIVISGRSDSTMNVKGIRIGTSEIYNVVQQVPGVVDSLCVCQDFGEGDERMVLFVSYKRDEIEFEKLVSQIKHAILNGLSQRHMPSLILEAPSIPYTITGKKVEILVKKIISKKPYSINHESLKDPSELSYFINLKI